MTLRRSPRISTVRLTESTSYEKLGKNTSNRVFLIGHSDLDVLNEPLLVRDVQDAIALLKFDKQSPLLRGLLEAYLAGARDIWLVSAAPMSEYEPDIELRDNAYYRTYRDRLLVTYQLLKEWDVADFVVPLEAPLNSSVDFLTPLVNHCAESFSLSGKPKIGFIGTRGTLDESLVQALASDQRIPQLGSLGKFVVGFAGDAVFNLRQVSALHTSSIATVAAAQLSVLPLDIGLTNRKIKNAMSPAHPELSDESIALLSESKINTAVRTSVGRRGQQYSTVFSSDNTMAQENSMYWSLAQTRVATQIAGDIRGLGKRAIGNLGMKSFREDVENYMSALVVGGVIRRYELDVRREDPRINANRVVVNVSVTPYFGIRDISMTVFVGPEDNRR